MPNFLVIGAQRAGTSLLHRILQAHPEVYVPEQRKEVHYFDLYFDRGVDWYRSFFPPAAQASRFRAIGEATPDYLATPEAPDRIHALLPDCRLVAVLRNPVDRAYSWYQYSRRSYNERRDFEAFVAGDPTALAWGLYHRHLQRYLGLFRREALLVLIYEELVQDPARELTWLAEFLGLTVAWPDPASLLRERVNASETPRFRRGFALARSTGKFLMRHDLNWPVRMAKRFGVTGLFGRSGPAPALSPAVRARLAAYYQEDVRELGALLQRDLAVWQL